MSYTLKNVIVFEFLGLEYDKIDTKIESVASVFDEIRQVTEIVTSKSLSRFTRELYINNSSFSSS